MKVPTGADIVELRRIVNKACADAFADRKDPRWEHQAINWGDLHFCELEMHPRVIVEEASPEATELQAFIEKRLWEADFDVEVETEW